MRRVRRGVGSLAVVAVLVGGCGGTEQQAAPTPTPTTALPTIEPPTVEPSTAAPTTPTTAPPTSIAPTAAPTGAVPAALAGRDWERIPTTQKVVALTFDGGGNDAGVDSILATLAREKVPATFFVTGNWVRVYPDRVRQLAATGNPVGNHSVTHPHFPQLTDAEIRTELATAEQQIRAVTGRAAKPLFRFPYGDRTPADIAVVNAAGYVPVRWTVGSRGYLGTSEGITAASVVQQVLDGLTPGAIVLLHLGAHPEDKSTLDADALPGIIRELRARGYGFVTMRALTG